MNSPRGSARVRTGTGGFHRPHGKRRFGMAAGSPQLCAPRLQRSARHPRQAWNNFLAALSPGLRRRGVRPRPLSAYKALSGKRLLEIHLRKGRDEELDRLRYNRSMFL